MGTINFGAFSSFILCYFHLYQVHALFISMHGVLPELMVPIPYSHDFTYNFIVSVYELAFLYCLHVTFNSKGFSQPLPPQR